MFSEQKTAVAVGGGKIIYYQEEKLEEEEGEKKDDDNSSLLKLDKEHQNGLWQATGSYNQTCLCSELLAKGHSLP